MVARTARALLACTAVAAVSACVTATPRNDFVSSGRQQAWADSVLASLSLRDKAAQMVWPWVLGDYTASDDPTYRRVERLVREQHVGGIIISVGSPTEIASKLNALQQASPLPLLVGADLETGAAFRARGGYFLPNAIDLGGATYFPYAMGIGATRDTAFAYQMGRIPSSACGRSARTRSSSRVSARRSFAAFRRTGCSPPASISPATAIRSRTPISSCRG
jgi:beta-N-acetylhexosaminidase